MWPGGDRWCSGRPASHSPVVVAHEEDEGSAHAAHAPVPDDDAVPTSIEAALVVAEGDDPMSGDDPMTTAPAADESAARGWRSDARDESAAVRDADVDEAARDVDEVARDAASDDGDPASSAQVPAPLPPPMETLRSPTEVFLGPDITACMWHAVRHLIMIHVYTCQIFIVTGRMREGMRVAMRGLAIAARLPDRGPLKVARSYANATLSKALGVLCLQVCARRVVSTDGGHLRARRRSSTTLRKRGFGARGAYIVRRAAQWGWRPRLQHSGTA